MTFPKPAVVVVKREDGGTERREYGHVHVNDAYIYAAETDEQGHVTDREYIPWHRIHAVHRGCPKTSSGGKHSGGIAEVNHGP